MISSISPDFRTGLLAPASYQALDTAEIARRYNGMGPGRIGGILVPDTMYGLRVTEAGNIHDHMYAECTGPEEKLIADLMMLVNCLIIIERDSRSFLLRNLRRRRAMTYFSAVADFGGRFIQDTPQP